MKIDIVTLFPEMVEPALGASMLGRARQRGLVDIRVANLRDYAEGKHRVTDDYPFGGGGGMILKPEPLFAAVEALRTPDARVILMDPRGRLFTQAVAEELGGALHLVLLCGRYEGVDERVSERVADEALSIGDYVLTGGELPALVFRGARVPAVLLSGDHARIARWRRTQALYRTWRARPELLERAALAAEERELVEQFKRGDTPE
ncbi:MAG: hypothetical protein AUG80_05360 [Candidatus Rokubacteria bacterium 13_1_20CM_4_68_9]|nr:MAG: hypothetical protein AUG80_05360 [Candidatus Rokubacteria bacterium 13_1_20CM_4_68_9]